MLKKILAPLILATASYAADSVLVFNELQYHPANELTETEWVELRSLQAVDVDISGWRIDGGIDYTFPAGTIMPGGGYIVVAAVPAQIPSAFGPFTGQLDNGGETLRLRNLNGRIMDELTYSDSGDWPIGADGSGATLARRAATAAFGAEQWSASRDKSGTPGVVNFAAAGTPNVRTRIIPIGATWKFLDDGSTPAGTWTSAAFDDSAWRSGATLIAGGGAVLPALKPSDLPTGLLAYWAFDEVSGTTAVNSANATFNGTMANGAAFVADVARGQVAQFDGTDDRMEVIDSGTSLPTLTMIPAMTAANDFTWAGWVWTSTASAVTEQTTSVIMGNRTAVTGADTSPREFFKITPGSTQYARNGTVTLNNYADLGTNAWTHMCLVKRGLNLDYYQNGIFVQTVPLLGAMVNTQMPFYVGGDRKTTPFINEHFQGRVDDVGLWTRALAAGEIAGLAGFNPNSPVLPSPAEQTTNAVTGTGPRYFRKTFTFTGSPWRTALELWPIADDGAVFYLNGAEIYRANVPPTSEVLSPAFVPAPIIIPHSALVKGTNVLSAEVHQFSGGNTDIIFGADLLTDEAAGVAPAGGEFVFSEISSAVDAGFFIELRNKSASAQSTGGWMLKTSAGGSFTLPAVTVPAGGYASFTAASIGLVPSDGLRLHLIAPDGLQFADARAITNSLRGLLPNGTWGHPSSATPGAANVVTLSDAIVINEIFYNAADPTPPALPSGEQWVELYNKSAAPVDVSGWAFTAGIDYTFPPATPPIPAGGFAVVAWNPATFATLHPGVTAYGPFSGSLGGSGDTITLHDANDNPADEVSYVDGGRWSQWADGGGSSLELIDPDSDNTKGEAWDASDESSHSTWQNVSISGLATNTPSNNPTTWNEFLFGLLNNGEFLIDDISVKDVTQGNIELIQNGNFSSGNADFWRIIGTHSGSIVSDGGNNVLKVVATAETEHMNNYAGTTLKNGASFHTLVSTDTYNITFRAKWLRGSNALHSRLYVNRLALKTLLNRPTTGGTPGAVNSRFVANVGPTFDQLAHSPVVPAATAPSTVTVKVSDPDGVATVQLFTSLNGAAFSNVAMTTSSSGVYSGTVAGQSAGALVQFYVRATDSLGAISFFPAGGAASRAMIPWADGRAQLTLASGAKPHNLRVVMPAADATELYRLENQMGNAARPCTVIMNETDIYYRAGVSLKSSEHGRFNIVRVGYNIEFPPDELFLGTHGGIAIDRSGGTTTGQKEILLKSLSILAGGIHAPQDDICRVIPSIGTFTDSTATAYDGSGMLGAAILSKTRLKGDYLNGQWDNGSDGMMYKYERIYVLTQTINAATRVVDAAIVPENPKVPQSTTSPPGVAVTNLGADSEFYRWHWLVESGRDRDDFTEAKNMTNAIGQAAGATFNNLADQYLDVNQWLRAHVGPTLYGVTDNYLAAGGAGSQHNTLFYFPPGKKGVLMPWDNDFLSQANPTTTSIASGGDIAKFIANPVWKRLYYGHMLDVLNRSFNTTTMTYWATHYSRFGTDDMIASVAAYLTPRTNYARDVILGQNGQVPPIAQVAFTRTSASPVTVATPFTTVTGDGWINIAEIRLQGSSQELAVTWTDDNSWSLQLPISAGANIYTLVAYSTTGASLGTVTVTVTGSGGIFPATTDNLIVSELNFNPPGSSDATEFIELQNITAATLDLSNCHFDEELGQGITYTFSSGVQLAPGARIIVARLRNSFLAAYPAVPAAQVAAGGFDPTSLDNGGERIVLYSAAGLPIFDFIYSDNLNPTDGGGRSLVRVTSSTNPSATDYTWRASTVDGGNPGISDALAFSGSANADADADGTPALLEYELGTSDDVNNALPLTVTRDISGALIAVFTRRANADDADLAIEAVTELSAAWAPATATRTDDTVVGTLRTETWQITPPVGAAKFFIRLKATLR